MHRPTSFRYVSSPARIIAGQDALMHLGTEVARTGARRAFVVCSRSIAQRTTLLERAQEVLGERYAGVFDGSQAESPLPAVEAGVAAARDAGADCIVAIGGGSVVVTARAITILLAEAGSIFDLCTQYPPDRPPVSPRLLQPKLPNVIVLTTPTTATNRAGAAVLDPARHRRLELFDPKTRPVAIFCDAAALLTAPASLFISTAATTLVGVVGSLQSLDLNPFGEGDLLEALRLLQEAMPRVLEAPQDPDPRIQLAVAALLSNRAADAGGGGGGGVVAALSHGLQARYEAVHQGAALSVLLAPGMRFNRPVLREGQARLAEVLGVRRAGMGPEEAATAAVAAVEQLLRQVGLPLRLRDLGVPEADLEGLATDAMQDFFLTMNPRPVRDRSELLDVLRDAW
ncbi:MAG: iron-containing alcohol dehydrogenase [Chloroflexi bacterium]|nr:iron-containing alcohol dehydrogenase [Chloroflexota bacterium]